MGVVLEQRHTLYAGKGVNIGGNGGHGYPHYKETSFLALTHTHATVLSTVCIYVYTGIAHFQWTN